MFIRDEFLLGTPTARRLYQRHAATQPIFDYHCHLSPQDLAENRRFQNLFEIWLEGDHYKWRAMRANGVPERLITGAASPWEKFQAWAATVPHTVRNPLHHWTHLELQRHFGISELLDDASAPRIWAQANEQLQELTPHAILKKFQVRAIGTTDDPTDDLRHHRALAGQGLATRVLPAFRPDKALNVHQPDAFNAWVQRLEAAADVSIGDFPSFLTALGRRIEAFHAVGCRLSDHGLSHCPSEFACDAEAASLFAQARRGVAASPGEQQQFAGNLLLFLGRAYAAKGWAMQLHLGALRNNNTRLLRNQGPDTGFDSIGDWPQAGALSIFLDRLDQENALPRTILYNLNPADNYVFAAMIGNFQDGTVAGKIQYGSGWWFLDQKEGMEWQINALSSLGLLSRFIGMVTDSRSFLSYPRHEYFRRVLCSLLGRDVENGEIPDDDSRLGPLIENICYGNARRYFNFPGVPSV